MYRRDTVLALLALGCAPIWSFAQQPPKVARIGFLGAETAAGQASRLEALRVGLRDLGYVEGRNIVIEFRWAEGNYDRLPDLAAELVGLKVDVIVVLEIKAALAAKRVTTTIPIVFPAISVPVASGLVATFAETANLSDTGGGTLRDTGSTWTLTGLDTGSVTNLSGTFAGMANLSDTGGGTLKDTRSTWNLTDPNTGSVTNLSGTFAGMANLSDTTAGTLQYPPGSTWTLTGPNTGTVTNLSGTFAGMTNLTDKGSLARPGGNITGSVYFVPELMAKRLELLREAVPHITQAAVLLNPANPTFGPILQAMEITAKSLELGLQSFEVRARNEFDSIFAAMAKRRVNAVVVQPDTMFTVHAKAIAILAATKRFPLAGDVEFAEAGGLIGYGANVLDLYRRSAYFVDKVLKGAKPGDLPVEQATKFELVINLKTAKALDLTIPLSILLRAGRVIE